MTWYQLPLPLQALREDRETRSRLAIELAGVKAARDSLFEGWHEATGYPPEESKFWDGYERRLRDLAERLIAPGT